MRRSSAAFAIGTLAIVLCAAPSVAQAPLWCIGDGGWGFRGAAFQYFPGFPVLIEATSRIVHDTEHTGCFGDIGARVRLVGLHGGACEPEENLKFHSSAGPITSVASKTCPTPACMPFPTEYRAGGEHWWSSYPPESDGGFTLSLSVFMVPSCEEDGECDDCLGDERCECACAGGNWELVPEAPGFCNMESPLLIDLEGRDVQYHLTSSADGVLFDFNGDGLRRRVAWTRADTAVGFLALDRNGNGMIDNGAELFGNHTRMRNGSRARHGFQPLAELDENGDGQIDGTDSGFSVLLVWVDRNHNGLSEPGELMRLSEAGVVRLFTDYAESSRRDRHGNLYRYSGRAGVVGPKGTETPRRIFDVFLRTER